MKRKLFISTLVILISLLAFDKSSKYHDEWYHTYSKIIEDTLLQQNENQIYFREIYIADGYELTLDGVGGISEGYPLDSANFMFYLQDITTKLDGIPELFIGCKNNNDIKLLAVYTFNLETHMAHLVSTVSVEHNSEIYLCKNNLVLEGNTSGGELIMVVKNGSIPFASFREEQDKEIIIIHNQIEWKSFLEWQIKNRTSYQFVTGSIFSVVHLRRFELLSHYWHTDLNRARLPIPPQVRILNF